MKIILLTQNDPFYLPESIEDLLVKIRNYKNIEVVSIMITKASPFGRNENFISKVKRTYRIFGLRFFLFYSFKFFVRKYILRKNVIKTAVKYNHPIWKLDNDINAPSNIYKLKQLSPDLVIIIAGNQIIKKKVLEIPKYGVINAHSSLLPDYKGLMPTFWVLRNNESKTGDTLFKLCEGIDDGPIINCKEIPIEPQMSQADLIKKTKIIANDLILESLELLKSPEHFKNNVGGHYYKFPTCIDVK